MFDYGQLHRSAFCERKCNFRLALMYFKSFLFPLVIPSPISASAALLVNRILVRADLKAGVLDAVAVWLVLVCYYTITSEL